MSEHSDPLEEILKRDDIPRKAKSAIREAFQKMKFLALHDQMTGLYNRAYYDNEIAKMEREREEYPVTVIFLDMDNLKQINDKYGHEAGDLAIKYVGHALKNNFRSTDLVARIGGDEFAAVLPKVKDYDTVERKIKKIREEIAQYTIAEELKLSVSIGVATGSSRNLAYVIKQADQRMYEEKRGYQSRNKTFIRPLKIEL